MASRADRLFYYSLTLGPALVVVVGLMLQPWFDPRLAFMDPIIAGQTAECCHLYYGSASNLGALYMAGAASACLLAAAALWPTGAGRGTGLFLLSAGALSAWLCLDDLFLLHEGVLPKLGVPQTAALGLDGLLLAAYLVAFRRRLLTGEAPLLGLALAFFALSAGLDVVLHSPSVVAVEDGAKLLGLACWAGFHWRAALDALSPTLKRAHN